MRAAHSREMHSPAAAILTFDGVFHGQQLLKIVVAENNMQGTAFLLRKVLIVPHSPASL
jgi:hypothetical protein